MLAAYEGAFDDDERADDLFQTYIWFDLERVLSSISNKAMVGIIGEYGSGKSVTLNGMKRTNRERWVEFEAWKYPNRKDMWEGFVLDFTKQLLPNEFQRVLDAIEGRRGKDLKQLISTSGKALDHFVPGAGIIADFAYFASSSPATRIFQIQDLLKKLINQIEYDITVVLEDVDRSGDAGIYFLETLSQFLRTHTLKPKIRFLTPISSESFQNYQDHYVKCLDYSLRFNPKRTHFNEFVTKTFDKHVWQGAASDRCIQIEEWLIYLTNKKSVNLRFLKFLLREADIKYQLLQEDGYNVDPLLTIIFVTSQYVQDDADSSQTIFEAIKDRQFLTPDLGFICTALWAIGKDIPFTVAENSIKNEKISEERRTIVVTSLSALESRKYCPMIKMQKDPGLDDSEFGLPDFYLY